MYHISYIEFLFYCLKNFFFCCNKFRIYEKFDSIDKCAVFFTTKISMWKHRWNFYCHREYFILALWIFRIDLENIYDWYLWFISTWNLSSNLEIIQYKYYYVQLMHIFKRLRIKERWEFFNRFSFSSMRGNQWNRFNFPRIECNLVI